MVRTRTGKTVRRESDIGLAPSPAKKAEFGRQREEESESDDDAPMEISSKKLGPDMMLVPDEEPEMSLFEQVQARKKEEEENRKEKAKQRRVKRKKVQEGEYVVKAKKVEMKVVTLSEGIKKPLEPVVNWKAELLKARTADKRVKGGRSLAKRAKWVGVTGEPVPPREVPLVRERNDSDAEEIDTEDVPEGTEVTLE